MAHITTLPASSAEALPGRPEAMPVSGRHAVNGSSLLPPFEGKSQVLLGMGCFWGVERHFWQLAGVTTTAVGYAAGLTPNPTYQEVCSGFTGHNEVVLVVFDEATLKFNSLLKEFWTTHDPTQGMQQGADRGTQYRSGIYVFSKAHKLQAEASRQHYQQALTGSGRAAITTEILDAPQFFYAEEYHQQYLAKNPDGYCNLGGTGIQYR